MGLMVDKWVQVLYIAVIMVMFRFLVSANGLVYFGVRISLKWYTFIII